MFCLFAAEKVEAVMLNRSAFWALFFVRIVLDYFASFKTWRYMVKEHV